MLYWLKIILDTLFVMGLFTCAVSDWQRRIIPGKLVAFLTILGLVQLGLMLGMGVSIWPNLIALLVTVPLYFFWTMNWIGGGDVKLLLAFIVGTIIGGVLSGLPFALGSLTIGNIIMCLLSRLLLIALFVPIYLCVSVAAKQKTWLCIVGSCAAGMLLFSVIPMVSPLTATMMNVILCLAGGVMFSFGGGAVSTFVLNKRDLV